MNTPQPKSTPVVTTPLSPDQISPKEVIARAAKLKEVARRNWPLLLGMIVLGGIIGYITDLTSKKRLSALRPFQAHRGENADEDRQD